MATEDVIFSFTFTTNSTSATSGFGVPPGFTQFQQAPPPKPAKPCPHRILGVACDITPTSLRTVYRKLAKANHPDIGPDAERATRTRRMALINAAYEEAKGQG